MQDKTNHTITTMIEQLGNSIFKERLWAEMKMLRWISGSTSGTMWKDGVRNNWMHTKLEISPIYPIKWETINWNGFGMRH